MAFELVSNPSFHLFLLFFSSKLNNSCSKALLLEVGEVKGKKKNAQTLIFVENFI